MDELEGPGSAPAVKQGSGKRARRPVPERTEPHRGWQHLYTVGIEADADADAVTIPTQSDDETARIVREGYRTLQENLRRGRSIARELHDASPGSGPLSLGTEAQALVRVMSQAFMDPALTGTIVKFARFWSKAFELPRRFVSQEAASPPASPSVDARIPLHPQERAEYRDSGRAASAAHGRPQLLQISLLRQGEWVGDLSIGGRVCRVQIRELEEL